MRVGRGGEEGCLEDVEEELLDGRGIVVDRLIGPESVSSFCFSGTGLAWGVRSVGFSFSGCLAGWRIRWRGLESKVSLSLRRLPCRAPGIVLVQIYIVLMIYVDVVLRMN